MSHFLEDEFRERRNLLSARMFLWGKLLFIFALITGIFNMLGAYRMLNYYTNVAYTVPQGFQLQTLGNMVLLGIHGIMIPLQAYFFYRFASQSKQAAFTENEQGSYESFRWLLKQTVTGALHFGLNSLWAVVNIMAYASIFNSLNR